MIVDHSYSDPVDSIAISKFKATCLAVMEQVRASGEPVLVTRRGEPVVEIVPASAPSSRRRDLGAMSGTGELADDLIEPAAPPTAWESVNE